MLYAIPDRHPNQRIHEWTNRRMLESLVAARRRLPHFSRRAKWEGRPASAWEVYGGQASPRPSG